MYKKRKEYLDYRRKKWAAGKAGFFSHIHVVLYILFRSAEPSMDHSPEDAQHQRETQAAEAISS